MIKEYVKDFTALADYMIEITEDISDVAVVLNAKQAEQLLEILLSREDINCGTIDFIGGCCEDETREYYVGLFDVGVPGDSTLVVDVLPVHVDHDDRGPVNDVCTDILVFIDEANPVIWDANDDGQLSVRVVTFNVPNKGNNDRGCASNCTCGCKNTCSHDDGDGLHFTITIGGTPISDAICETLSSFVQAMNGRFSI